MPEARDIARLDRLFRLKVFGAQTMGAVEKLALYPIPPAYATGVFLTAAFANAVQALPYAYRPVALGAAIFAAVAPLPVIAWRHGWRITREDALRRLDRNLGDPDIPAQILGSNYHTGSPELWQSHREQLLRSTARQFRVGWPKPPVPRMVTAAGALIAASLCASAYIAGPERSAHLHEAFNFHAPIVPPPPPNVMASVEPPEGIDAEQLYLSEKNATQGNAEKLSGSVHKLSVLNLSVLDGTAKVTVDGQDLAADKPLQGKGGHITTIYKPFTFATDGLHTVQVANGPRWTINVEKDEAPTVAITHAEPWDNRLSLRCTAQDDNGIKGGAIEMRVPEGSPDADPPDAAKLPTVPLSAELCQPHRW